jgi:Uma2 family endonuclease
MVAFPKSTQTRVTFAEYSQRPETNQIVELIDGEIIMNPPLFRHQQVLMEIAHTIRIVGGKAGWIGIAPVGLCVDDYNSLEPDILWVRKDNPHCTLGADGRFWQGGPDLVVELASPSAVKTDRGRKFKLYEQIGVGEYWLVDPNANYVEVYRLVESHFQQVGLFEPPQTFTSMALGGISISIAEWFPEPVDQGGA